MTVAAAVVCGLASSAVAQSNIDPTLKFVWGENIGWLNLRDANNAQDGVVIGVNVLAGFVWGENIGWIDVGDGSPASASAYGNVDSSDFGVNVQPDGFLSGFGWGENIGWVNFATVGVLGAELGARIEAGALRGFAWSENVGWINLGEDGVEAEVENPSDFNNDGQTNGADLASLLANWGIGGGLIDINGDGAIDGADLAQLLANWGS